MTNRYLSTFQVHRFDDGARDFVGSRAEWPGRILSSLLRPATSAACAVTDKKIASLTYDDGPHPESTPQVLDALAEHGVRATFFLLTENARERRAVIERLIAEGHEIGLHGHDHRRQSTMSTAEAVRYIRDSRRELEDLTQQPVTLYRPAYGAQTLAQAVATRREGLELLMWTTSADDWLGDPVDVMVGRVMGGIHPGAIVLLHDNLADMSPQEAPQFSRYELTSRVIEASRARGFDFCTASRLLEQGETGRALIAELQIVARRRARAMAG